MKKLFYLFLHFLLITVFGITTAISRTLCAETGSSGYGSAIFAQRLTMGSTGLFIGSTVDGATFS